MTGHVPPVVVGVDGSVEAREAVRVGAQEAHRRGAPLLLVLAFPWPEGTRVAAPEGFDGRAVMRTVADLALEASVQVADEVGTGAVETRLIEGKAPEVLTDCSQTAQVLCVGTQGIGSARDLLLGSTAAALVHSAACPLLVVPRRAGASVDVPHGVVVGLEGGDGDPELLAEAFPAAEARGCEVLAVHAWQHRVPGPGRVAVDPLVSEETARHREEAYLDDVLDGWPDRYPTVPVRRAVEHARPAPTLVAAAMTAELLVVGHRRRLLDRLGSTTHTVLHRAACPVLIVPIGRPVPGAQPAADVAARSAPARSPAAGVGVATV